jgi:uncharacterized metal-binding protein YceD (DUF177 family)
MTKLALSLSLQELGDGPVEFSVEASQEECEVLIERFGLVSLAYLRGKGQVRDKGHGQGILIEGTIEASLEQPCSVTLKPVAETVAEDFALLLVDPEMANRMDEDEAYLDESAPDYDALEGDKFDVGEVIAQTLSISMNPYPRADDAEVEVPKNDNFTANAPELEKPNPFAELGKLKDKS